MSRLQNDSSEDTSDDVADSEAYSELRTLSHTESKENRI